jgi:hypothetical protein
LQLSASQGSFFVAFGPVISTSLTELDGLFRFASNMFAPQEKAAIGRVLTGGTPDELHRSIITEAARQVGIATDASTVAGRQVERTVLRGYATLLDASCGIPLRTSPGSLQTP